MPSSKANLNGNNVKLNLNSGVVILEFSLCGHVDYPFLFLLHLKCLKSMFYYKKEMIPYLRNRLNVYTSKCLIK
jgi:hypothetical protein